MILRDEQKKEQEREGLGLLDVSESHVGDPL